MLVDGINIFPAVCIVWSIQLLKTESGNYTVSKPDTSEVVFYGRISAWASSPRFLRY